MNDDIGGADYNNGHVMVFGNNSYKELDYNTDLDIFTYDADDKEYSREEKEFFYS